MRLSKNVYKQIRKFEFQVFHSFIFGLMTVYLCATLLVFAGARSVPYGPGDTLDPDCAPYDTNCFVQLSNSGSSGGGSSSDNNFSSIHVSGGSLSVASPASTSASITYNTDVGYPDNGYAHNYRVYSYKDTSSGRVYSSTYASIPAPEGTIGDPANLQITQQPTEDTSAYDPNSSSGNTFNFRIYAFKNVPGGRVYSSNYTTLDTDFVAENTGSLYTLGLTWDPVDGADGYRILKYTDTGMAYDYGHDVLTNSFTDSNSSSWSQNPIIITSEGILDQNQSQLLYTVNLSWDAVPGVDGYRIVKSNQNTNIGYSYFGYVSQNYDVGYDTTSTSIIDDACNTVCFDSNKGDVSLTTAYGESSDLNGLFSLSGPILLNSNGYLNWGGTSGSDGYGIRDNAGTLEYKNSNGTWSSFATSGGGASGEITVDVANYSVFTGGAFNSSNAAASVFLGDHAGSSASSAIYSVFLGNSAGNYATNAYYSNFIGRLAGNIATNAAYSNFIGNSAGYGATDASYSSFIGFQAGYNATNAVDSLFLGTNAGVDDQVNNRDNNGYSILLGPWTSTGGYSNSIALGGHAVNTSSYQLMLGNAGNGAPINQVVISGANAYLNFTGTAGSDGYGIRDNNGTLEYKNSGGSWSTLGAGVGGASLDGNNNFILGGGSTNTARSNFIGLGSGVSSYAATDSNFLGSNAGNGAIYANSSNFFGYSAGVNAIYANSSNFFGQSAGANAESSYNSNFFGEQSGFQADNAANSNFFGDQSGFQAYNSYRSNFLGSYAGYNSDDAHDSNFFGEQSGFQADNAANSNFFGQTAGSGATNASSSNFIGHSAGYNATNASSSNFIGNSAGSGATNAAHSTFIGDSAGQNAINAVNAIFIGESAGAGDTIDTTYNGSYGSSSILIGRNTSTNGFINSIAIGQNAINTSNNQFMLGSSSKPINQVVINGTDAYLNFGSDGGSDGYGIRDNAGTLEYKNSGGSWGPFGGGASLNDRSSFIIGGGANVYYSNFMGYFAGSGATGSSNSNFLGSYAGYNATNAYSSNFFGYNAGSGAADAIYSNFFGTNAGQNVTNGVNSNFLGYEAGREATNAFGSNFLGYEAGRSAANASNSIFFGSNTGNGATNAANSIFIGSGAGSSDTVNNTTNGGDYSILIGQNTSTGGYSNSIALGKFATNTASNQLMIGSSSYYPINTTIFKGSSSTQCTITTGTGISCSSDIRLKKNIMTLDNIVYSLKTTPTNLATTLDRLTVLTPVTYNWTKEKNTDPKHIGLIAQELEQVFPLVVSTDTDGFKSVNYANLTPYIIQAIKEMNIKVALIPTFTDPTLYSKISEFLKGIAEKGTAVVDSIITKKVKTDELCVGNVCVTSDQFLKMVQSSSAQPVSTK